MNLCSTYWWSVYCRRAYITGSEAFVIYASVIFLFILSDQQNLCADTNALSDIIFTYTFKLVFISNDNETLTGEELSVTKFR